MSGGSLKEIIEIAVGNELEAQSFYRSAALKAEDAYLKQVFENLANEELGHQRLLEGYLNSGEKLFFAEAQDYGVSESLEEPKLSTEMGFVDAIALAIKKEADAMKMYQSLAEHSQNLEQRHIFLELVKMETGHKAELEEIYSNVAYAEVW